MNRVPAYLAGVKAGRVYLCRVAGNTVCAFRQFTTFTFDGDYW